MPPVKTTREATKGTTVCAICKSKLMEHEAYGFRNHTLCETCCMTARMSRSRKTHWQYLSSIKRDYLQPAEADLGNLVSRIENGD